MYIHILCHITIVQYYFFPISAAGPCGPAATTTETAIRLFIAYFPSDRFYFFLPFSTLQLLPILTKKSTIFLSFNPPEKKLPKRKSSSIFLYFSCFDGESEMNLSNIMEMSSDMYPDTQ